jgi:hypothetical protein
LLKNQTGLNICGLFSEHVTDPFFFRYDSIHGEGIGGKLFLDVLGVLLNDA